MNSKAGQFLNDSVKKHKDKKDYGVESNMSFILDMVAVITLDPTNEELGVALANIVNVAYEQCSTETKVRIFEKAAQLNPENYSVYYGLAHCYIALDKAQAVKCFKKYLELNPPAVELRQQEFARSYLQKNSLKLIQGGLTKTD